tara:strand:+ start:66937 stop:67950 length:1014 start_codon:yes stop_codon:yes gene_type:complete
MSAGKTRKKINTKGSRASGGGGSGTVTAVSKTLGTTGTDISLTINNPTTTPDVNLQIPTASAVNRGALSSADWSTFNSKGSGTVTAVSGTSPVVSSGGTTPAISMPPASTTTSGYLSATDWNYFNQQLQRLIPITKAQAETIQNVGGTGTAIPGQWYKVTGTGGGPIVANEIESIILVGDISGKFNIQAWAEVITTVKNFYTPCFFKADFKLDKPNGIADLWTGRLNQSGSTEPSITNTHLNNLGETPNFDYVSLGEYNLNVTGDHFKANNIFLPIFEIIRLVDQDAIYYISVTYGSAFKLIIKTFVTNTGTGFIDLSDDVLDKTTIRLQRALVSDL